MIPAHGFARRRTRRRGQALVEFALVAPLFIVVLLAAIEVGRYIYHYEMLNNAAREGVRYAIVHGALSGDPTGPPHDPTGDDIKLAVSQASLSLIGVGDMTIPDPIYAGPNGTSNKRGSNVTVSVTYTYASIIPLVPPISVSAESTGVVNN